MKTEVSTDDVDAAVHDFVVSKNAYPSPLGISGWMEFHVSDVEDFQNVLSPGESDLRENTNIELEDTLPKFNMEPRMMVSERNLLFQGAIFRFHVKLWEGIRLENEESATNPPFLGFKMSGFQKGCIKKIDHEAS